MRRAVHGWLACGVLLAVACAGARGESLRMAQQAFETSTDPLIAYARQVRQRPEEHAYLDLALRVAREIYPRLDEEEGRKTREDLRRLGADLKARLNGAGGPAERVRRLNAFVYGTLGLRTADFSAPGKEPPGLYFPHVVLKTRQGLCLGLTLVNLALCQHADLPVHPAHAPQHIYLRYEEGGEVLNLETTKGGRLFSVEDVLARYQRPREELEKAYFRRIGKLEVLGDLLNAAAWCSAVGTAERPLAPERALLAAKGCVALDPHAYNNWDTLAEAERHAGCPAEALVSLQKALDLQPPAVGVYDKEYWLKRLKVFQEAVEKAGSGEGGAAGPRAR